MEPRWDGESGAAMRTRGVVVHEESVLEALLEFDYAGRTSVCLKSSPTNSNGSPVSRARA